MADIQRLKKIFRKAWARDTSSDPENWSPDNPAWGQCAVTACALQDIIGGDIIWSQATLPDGKEISHYFNKRGSREIDFTRGQFPKGTHISPGQSKTEKYPSTRDYILSFPATAARYKALTKNLATFKSSK